MDGRKYDSSWAGRLTKENIEKVTRLMTDLLSGKNFAIATTNEHNTMPELKLNVHLIDSGIEMLKQHKKEVGFKVSSSFGNLVFKTRLEKDTNPDGFETPYFNFNGNEVAISSKSETLAFINFKIVTEDKITQKTTENHELGFELNC